MFGKKIYEEIRNLDGDFDMDERLHSPGWNYVILTACVLEIIGLTRILYFLIPRLAKAISSLWSSGEVIL